MCCSSFIIRIWNLICMRVSTKFHLNLLINFSNLIIYYFKCSIQYLSLTYIYQSILVHATGILVILAYFMALHETNWMLFFERIWEFVGNLIPDCSNLLVTYLHFNGKLSEIITISIYAPKKVFIPVQGQLW